LRSFLKGLLIVAALIAAAFGAVYFLFPREVAEFAANAERHAAHLQRRELDIPGYHIVYLDTDDSRGPPLLLLHGIGADKDNWTRVAKYLTPRYRVIAVDLPGFGESDKPMSARYRVEDQVANVQAIAQALKLDRFDLGGNSMGGWIAAAYAAKYPQQVRSLWLVDPAGVSSAEPSEMIKRIRAGRPVPLFAATPDQFHEVLRFVFVKPPYVPGAVLKVLAQRQALNYELNLKIFGELRDESTSLETTLATPLTTPTLITWGDHDRVLDVSGGEILHRLLPNSRLAIEQDVGHLPMLEAPRLTAQDYLHFRDAVDAAGAAVAPGTAP
jgi:pimeloyl-ACP methyl ester carboxylesterase